MRWLIAGWKAVFSVNPTVRTVDANSADKDLPRRAEEIQRDLVRR
jgi:hypothetical protein